MLSALLPLHDLVSKPDRATLKQQQDHDFTLEQLFNPLSVLDTVDTDDDTSDLSSTLSSACQRCEAEISRLASDFELDDEGLTYCKQCAIDMRRRRVRFNDNHTVIPIPSFRNLTPEEYFAVWDHPKEREDMMYRNRIEYKIEGHWKMVLEEDQFVLCSDGKLYHPVTVRLYLQHLEQQKALAKQQEQAQWRTTGRKEVKTPPKIHARSSTANATPKNNPSSPKQEPTKQQPSLPRTASNIVVPNLAVHTVPRLTACVA